MRPMINALMPTLLLLPLVGAEGDRDWRRTILRGATPDGEIVRQTIGNGDRPNILERWWRGHRVRWLDEAGTMRPDDLMGSPVNGVLQMDLNGDGLYDGPGDLLVRWCDTDHDGVPDVQAVVVGPDKWDAAKKAYANAGDFAIMINHDRRGMFWWVDWTSGDVHHGFWARNGRNAWLGNYHGNNTYTHAIAHPSLLKDPSLAWENPFEFFDEDGDGCSEMSIRWGAGIGRKDGRVEISPNLSMAHVSYDLDNNSGYGNETSYDLTLMGTGGKEPADAVIPLPGFAGSPVFDPCFQDNAWRRLESLRSIDRAASYKRFFDANWQSMTLTVDEDGDDFRWERVESYQAIANGKPVDPFSASVRTQEMGDSVRPGPNFHPQADSLGDRGEFDLDNSGKGKLYIGRFDHKIHLYGAEWGAWLVDREGKFHGGAMGGQDSGPRATAVGEVVRYDDTDHDGFIDTISFSYQGDRKFDLVVDLKEYAKDGDDPQKADLIDPRALGWKGMHDMYLKLAAQAWDDAMMIYRAAWTRDLTSPELDRLAASSSLRQRHMNAWWITQGIYRAACRRLSDEAQKTPDKADECRKTAARLTRVVFTGKTDEAVQVLKTVP